MKKKIPTPMPDIATFFKALLDAYHKQQQYEPFDYVDVYKVADIFCRTNGCTFHDFNLLLQRFYLPMLKAGCHISLEVDAAPHRRASIMRRKERIIKDGATIAVIAMRG